jgi:hypothetical protein
VLQRREKFALGICSLRRKDMVVARSEPYRANGVCEWCKRQHAMTEFILHPLFKCLKTLRSRFRNRPDAGDPFV